MAENKTKPTGESVHEFLGRVADPRRRQDALALCSLMERTLGESPQMWGSSIVGFGSYRYRYESGREGEAAAAAFSPRAKDLVVYLAAHSDRTNALLERLGKNKTSKCCVYIKRLADVDETVLGELIADSYVAVKAVRTPG